MEYSTYQRNIFNHIQTTRDNIIVQAVAGSGKSFTLEHSIKHILETEPDATVLALVFNKHNATSLASKVNKYGSNVEVKTIHSLGFNILAKGLNKRITVNNDKYTNIIKKYTNYRKISWKVISFVNKLIHFMQVNLMSKVDEKLINQLVDTYNIYNEEAMEEFTDKYTLKDCLNEVIKEGLEQSRDNGIISFDDMLYAPLMLNIPSYLKVDYLLIDEAQDLSFAQLNVALRVCHNDTRVFAFGDKYQAIQMFAGAMSNSMRLIKDKVDAVELPLSICYRCPTSHIDLAKEIVPYIEAREDAPEGIIMHQSKLEAIQSLENNDLVICKHNAPVIRMAIKAIKQGVRGVRVRGKDIAKEIKMHYRRITKEYNELNQETIQLYDEAHMETLRKRKASDKVIEMFADTVDCLYALLEFSDDEIEALFADNGRAIWFSSVHKAKGLEATNVYILDPHLLDEDYVGNNKEQVRQRINLKYVALTRAIEKLVFID